jgi:isopentenyl-diphosphate delta-isomerase
MMDARNNSDFRSPDIGLDEIIIAIGSSGEPEYYPINKWDAHVNNIPHMAISVFVVCDDHMLLQRRAPTKYHSPGTWANTVCSHPRWNESVESCARRRLAEEIGCELSLVQFTCIEYQAAVGELYENERVSCFVGRTQSQELTLKLNPQEVSEVCWLTLPQIRHKIQHTPEQFSAWFKIYMDQYAERIEPLMLTNSPICVAS